VVHEATGLGANRVYKLDVIDPAIFPDQLPVALSVYVALRFMKRPVLVGMGVAILRVWTLAVRIFALKMFA
jgi:hypothetical protein